MRRLVVLVGVTLAPLPGIAQQLEGPSRVIDGDTVAIGSVRVRLEGIDAPETGQDCQAASGGSWDCGAAATRELGRLIAGADVVCTVLGEDRHRRPLGRCTARGIDLNAEMVRGGLAWAFVKYSTAFVELEAEARRRRIGIWQGPSLPAWEWRAQRWQAEAASAPSGCAIKGNISARGRLYHLPWSPWYAAVRLDEGRGERWFCSEDEAMSAGWRPAIIR